MFNTAFAMGTAPGAAGQQGGGFAAFVPLILMFIVFYFLLIRPQQKKAKEHQAMVSSLEKGAKIITTGGIYGTITKTDENTVTVEIADNVKIKVVRSNIATIQ